MYQAPHDADFTPLSLVGVSSRSLLQPWMDALWARLPRPKALLVLLETTESRMELAGIRPDSAAVEHLRPLIETVMAGGGSITSSESGGPWRLVQPACVDGRVSAVVCIELEVDPGMAAVADVSSHLDWGLGWLAMVTLQRQQSQSQAWVERSRRIMDCTLRVLAEEDFRAAALSAVNTLAADHGADVVQLGWWDGRGVRVMARSGAAWHDDRANLVEMAGQVMCEAIDLGISVRASLTATGQGAPAAGIEAYLRSTGAVSLLLVLLRNAKGTVGALLLERKVPFSEQEQASTEALAVVLGPLLTSSERGSRGLWRHLKEDCRRAAVWLTDGTRPALKVGVALLAGLLLISGLMESTFRVAAPCQVEGKQQLSLPAPFTGYIRDAMVRAGDTVRKDQVMAVMDDRDLQLEKTRWEADLQVALRKEREAMASGQRVEQRLAAAQADQARAQLELVLHRLGRLEIRSAFDGFVLSGDLSQQIGAPVEQGKVLFEVAPLEAWRVVLKVDERDVAYVSPGQTGEMILTSLPGESFRLRVSSVTSVASAEDGRNSFRVEAALDDEPGRLRPAMAGVAKLEVGQRTFAWIWTRRLLDWLRLTIWEWWP